MSKPITCISCGQIGRHSSWCPCKDAPTHMEQEPKDLTGSERKVNCPEPKEEQISEYEKHLERTIKFWESKYRKLEENAKKWESYYWEISERNTKLEEENEKLKSENKSLHEYWMPTCKNEERLKLHYSDELETLKVKAKGLQSENSLLLGKIKEAAASAWVERAFYRKPDSSDFGKWYSKWSKENGISKQ